MIESDARKEVPARSDASSPARPGQERTIYALTDIAPETQAYALARYSRSSASLRESVAWISGQKAADFLETFYFAYGHKSIADMAHITLALENISVLAAIAVEDEALWDGQERSTRYQDFSKSGYITPPELAALPPAAAIYTAAADRLFQSYSSLTRQLYAVLAEVVPRPPEMETGNYKRTLNARILDVTRTLLPYATRTSVGQVTSARVLERQLARLLSSPFEEIRQIATEMKAACKEPAFSPLAVRMEAALQAELERNPEAAPALHNLAGVVAPTEPAPTLVKYAEPSAQPTRVAQLLGPVVTQYLSHLTPAPGPTVKLAENDPPVLEAVTTLLYRHSDLAYSQIQPVVRDMPPKVRAEIYDLAHSARDRHDGWLREQHSGYGRLFDLLIDAKSMQDFFRHRRGIQIRQEITPRHGFVTAQEWFGLGLPRAAVQQALASGLAERYEQALQQAGEVVQQVGEVAAQAAPYLLPLGFRRRALFKMDDAQVAYIVETRSQPQGHFAYRLAAQQMWEELHRVDPLVARWVRLTPFELEESSFLKR